MGVTLTEKAASEVKKIITEQNLPEGTVLRVGVQGGGCSGFSYSLGFDTVDLRARPRHRGPRHSHGRRQEVRPLPRRHRRRLSTTAWRSGASCSTTPTSSRAAAAAARSRFKFGRWLPRCRIAGHRTAGH